MLIKRCMKCDLHFSFPTRIRSYPELFWSYTGHTETDTDTGQDMTAFQDFTTKSQISSLSQCNHDFRGLKLFKSTETAIFCVNQKFIPSTQTQTAPVQGFSIKQSLTRYTPIQMNFRLFARSKRPKTSSK